MGKIVLFLIYFYLFLFFLKSDERDKKGTGWAEDAAVVSSHQDSFT